MCDTWGKQKDKMMKKLVIILILFLPTFSFGQYQYGFLQETFFGRQPSARAEAMGKSYSSLDGDLTTVFFNPAGAATIKGLEVNGSLASPYYNLDKAKYNFIGIGYKFKDYLIIGLSRNYFTLGEKIYNTNINGNNLGSYSTPNNSNYCLTVSSQPVKNLFIGLNTNYFIWQPIDKAATTLYFDFGVIKKLQFLQKETSEHSINIGANIENFNYAKVTLDFNGKKSVNNLPVITRFGANYQFVLNKHLLIDTLKTFELLLQGEYQNVLNSDYHSAIRTGGEIMILEILSVRAGYYEEKVYNFGFPSENNAKIKAFTYGLGLQFPFYKLTKIPLKINFDYTSLPQASYSKTFTSWGNFTSYNLRINWLLKN